MALRGTFLVQWCRSICILYTLMWKFKKQKNYFYHNKVQFSRRYIYIYFSSIGFYEFLNKGSYLVCNVPTHKLEGILIENNRFKQIDSKKDFCFIHHKKFFFRMYYSYFDIWYKFWDIFFNLSTLYYCFIRN